MRSQILKRAVALAKGRRRVKTMVTPAPAGPRPSDPDAVFRAAKDAIARAGLQGKVKPLRFQGSRLLLRGLKHQRLGPIGVGIDEVRHTAAHTSSHDRPKWTGFARGKVKRATGKEMSALGEQRQRMRRFKVRFGESEAILDSGSRRKDLRLLTAYKRFRRFRKD